MSTAPALASVTTMNAYTMLQLDYDPTLKTLFSWMKPFPRPCFTPTLLDEVTRADTLLQDHGGQYMWEGKLQPVHYVVYGSGIPGIYNLGGDLNLFVQAIMRQDRALLQNYAHQCVANQLRRHRGMEADITTVALVQGKALGGGFECALATQLLIAERSATMSLPETLFNLFPGMGALSFLGRKVGLRKAEEIITSGATYSAKELYDLGVVDEVVEDGTGIEATRALIAHRQKRHNTYRALNRAKLAYQPVTESEMISIVDAWVDGALRLEVRDLKMMTRLVRAQDKLANASPEDLAIEALFATPARAAVNAA